MAFKSARQFNDEKYDGKFNLRNDLDEADVIFLYRNYDDVLIADTHYLNSSDYSGYVQCTGKGCPVCSHGGIRLQTKLFVPLYNLTTDRIEFWDRSPRFENVLNKEVFRKYDTPIDYVFTITRHGDFGDRNTTYSIVATKKNSVYSYEQILDKFGTKMPDAYERICRDYSVEELQTLLSHPANKTSDDDLPDYSVTPRNPSTISNPFESTIPNDSSDFDDEDGDDSNVDNVSF